MDLQRGYDKTSQEAVEIYKKYLVVAGDLKVCVPKTHLMIHILLRSTWFGNPLSYAVWEDESANKILKSVLHFCHQHTFEHRAFEKIGPLLKRRRLH